MFKRNIQIKIKKMDVQSNIGFSIDGINKSDYKVSDFNLGF
jgi:hypothetical protein